MISNLLMTIFSTQSLIYDDPDYVFGFGVVFGLCSIVIFGIIAVIWYKKNPDAIKKFVE